MITVVRLLFQLTNVVLNLCYLTRESCLNIAAVALREKNEVSRVQVPPLII